MTVVAIGKNSFLAQGVRKNNFAKSWVFLSHDEVEDQKSVVQNASILVNFAFSPDLLKEDRREDAETIDEKLAGLIAGDCHYISLSSRMVYGPGDKDKGLKEDSPCLPETPYGRNKLYIENSLRNSIAPEKLTILRPSNIFDYEPGRHTFFGAALKNLRLHNTITFDIAADCVRDFLPLNIFAKYLEHIVQSPIAGTYNLGCGFGVTCGQIAAWIIEGYGHGEVVVTDQSRKGEFFLDMSKTLIAYGLDALSESDIRKACIACGHELKSASFPIAL